MRKTRISLIAAGFGFALAGLAFFVAVRMLTPALWHASHDTGEWSRREVDHFRVVQTDDGRGSILFANGQPWSGVWTSRRISNSGRWIVIGLHSERGGRREPVIGQVGLPDVWPSRRRWVEEQGRSGLEARFDSILSGHPSYAGQPVDALGSAAGTGVYRRSARSGSNLRTTIDPAWQQVAEDALASAGVTRGAVVLLDVDTADVRAMASTDPVNGTRNWAVQAITPGSIFKVITAAVALETYRVRPHSLFVCPGGLFTAGVHMHCWRVHGTETFEQALAASCDTAFAEVGIRLGHFPLSVMAKRLGILGDGMQKVQGVSVLPEAQRGHVFSVPGEDAGLLANTAVGQQDVRLSPVQAANVMRTIANGGRYRDTRLVMDVEGGSGVVHRFSPARQSMAMSAATAEKIGRAMRLAVTSDDGTAHELNGAAVAYAVKTGTAELPGGKRVNGWVAGFFPYRHPQFAFCIMVPGVDANQAHRVTRQIALQMASAYRQFYPSGVIR